MLLFSKASPSPACPAQEALLSFFSKKIPNYEQLISPSDAIMRDLYFPLIFFCTWEIFNNDYVDFKIRKRNVVGLYFPKQLTAHSGHSSLGLLQPLNIVVAMCLLPPNPLPDLMERLILGGGRLVPMFCQQGESLYRPKTHWAPVTSAGLALTNGWFPLSTHHLLGPLNSHIPRSYRPRHRAPIPPFQAQLTHRSLCSMTPFYRWRNQASGLPSVKWELDLPGPSLTCVTLRACLLFQRKLRVYEVMKLTRSLVEENSSQDEARISWGHLIMFTTLPTWEKWQSFEGYSDTSVSRTKPELSLWVRSFFVAGAVLCIVECAAASLVATH